MSENQGTFNITKPVSAWNKPLKADFGELFKAMSKGVLHFTTGSWVELGCDTADALAAVGFEKDPGQLAWLLIRKSLTRAVFRLVQECYPLMDPGRLDDAKKFDQTLDLSMENSNLTLDRRLFERPAELPVLGDIKKPFEQWLEGYGLCGADAKAVSGRLNSFFITELHREWAGKPDVYAPIKEAVDTPFTRADERQRAWAAYAAVLQDEVNQNVFGETFGLADVYVKLRAYYEERVETDKDGDEPRDQVPGETDVKRIVVDLESELDAWLQANKREDAIRIITGGPGCGKSSFVKMYAAKLSQNSEVRVLLIPLHLFNVTGGLVASVREFVSTSGIVRHNPLDEEEGDKRLLIIFDGLDELSMQGNVGVEAAREFVEEVIRAVGLRNLRQAHLQVIITGREVVVQANKMKFRHLRQIIQMLPYHIGEDKAKEYEDAHELLKSDQRDIWWQMYGRVKGLEYKGMPKELNRDELHDVTTQPLLNYLIALSLARGKVDFSKNVNLNAVYGDLLNAVYERGYDHRHKAISEISKADFVAILEEIGLSSWHGNGRTTTIAQIKEYCDAADKGHLLDQFQKGAEKGMTGLLAAFYFRQASVVGPSGAKTFEFTHKSFREYLTSRRLVYGIELMKSEMARKEEKRGGGWGERQVLEYWGRMCGPTAIDQDLFRFLCDEVALKYEDEPDAVGQWQKMFIGLIEYMLVNGMPMERMEPGLTYKQQVIQARNAEEALLVAMNACACNTKEISSIKWPTVTSAVAWLRGMAGQQCGLWQTLANRCLSYTDFRLQEMHLIELFNSNLRHSVLEGSGLMYSCLRIADLVQANLQRVTLYGANLQDANLQGANLQRANLCEATLQGANLQGANLHEANLRRANLHEANLRRANLERANLREANLHEANLRRANLREANLGEANLTGAILEGAIFKEAQYDELTQWPEGFDPDAAGAILAKGTTGVGSRKKGGRTKKKKTTKGAKRRRGND